MIRNIPDGALKLLEALPCAAAAIRGGEIIYKNPACGTEFDGALASFAGTLGRRGALVPGGAELRRGGEAATAKASAAIEGLVYTVSVLTEEWGTLLLFSESGSRRVWRPYFTKELRDDVSRAMLALDTLENGRASEAGTMVAKNLYSIMMKTRQLELINRGVPTFEDADAAKLFRTLCSDAGDALTGLGVAVSFSCEGVCRVKLDRDMMTVAFYSIVSELMKRGRVGNSLDVSLKPGEVCYLTLRARSGAAEDARSVSLDAARAAAEAHGGTLLDIAGDGGRTITLSFRSEQTVSVGSASLRAPVRVISGNREVLTGLSGVLPPSDFRRLCYGER